MVVATTLARATPKKKLSPFSLSLSLLRAREKKRQILLCRDKELAFFLCKRKERVLSSDCSAARRREKEMSFAQWRTAREEGEIMDDFDSQARIPDISLFGFFKSLQNFKESPLGLLRGQVAEPPPSGRGVPPCPQTGHMGWPVHPMAKANGQGGGCNNFFFWKNIIF